MNTKRCYLCGNATDSFAANPSLWGVKLGNDRDAHVGCIREHLDLLPAIGRALAAAGQVVQQHKHAMAYLGDVLYAIADMPDENRCQAINDALAFYNAAYPGKRVELTAANTGEGGR